jgi:hypothetical protein
VVSGNTSFNMLTPNRTMRLNVSDYAVWTFEPFLSISPFLTTTHVILVGRFRSSLNTFVRSSQMMQPSFSISVGYGCFLRRARNGWKLIRAIVFLKVFFGDSLTFCIQRDDFSIVPNQVDAQICRFYDADRVRTVSAKVNSCAPLSLSGHPKRIKLRIPLAPNPGESKNVISRRVQARTPNLVRSAVVPCPNSLARFEISELYS